MIITITLNPAIDTNYTITNFQKVAVNRVEKIEKYAGGKGINVTKVLHQLKADVVATGFLGGANGRWILDTLSKEKIKTNFLKIEEESRICIAILEQGNITEILEQGPTINDSTWMLFLHHLESILPNEGIVCASGSLAKGLPKNSYEILIKKAKEKNLKFFLDTSSLALKEGIKANPFFIKPNKDELEDYFNIKIDNEEILITYAKKLYETGIDNVLITLGGNGALLINKEGIFKASLPKVKVINTVGSGDSTVAGFAYGTYHNKSTIDTLKFALACGTSNAMEESTGKINPNNLKSLTDKIEVIKL